MAQIAIAEPNNRISFLDLDDSTAGWVPGGSPAMGGFWPVPRPGGGWTASVVDQSSRLEHRSAIGEAEVPGSLNDPPALIGPRLTHYAAWSPDGKHLCYVVPDGRALSLRTWTPGESGYRAHLSAAPVFPAWVPNANWLVCHHGSTLSAFEIVTREQRTLSPTASGFRTPAVTSDGSRIAWGEVSDGAVRVVLGSVDGESETIGRLSGGVALGFRPGTHELFGAVQASSESSVFSYVARLSDGDGKQARLVQGPLVAFWWSPDGQRIASLHPTYSGDGRFQIRIHDAAGNFLRAMEPLIPSSDVATLVGFFDQYATSHPSWSGDSRWFAICGKLLSEGPHPSFSGGHRDRAFVWDTVVGGPTTALAEGSFAVFERP